MDISKQQIRMQSFHFMNSLQANYLKDMIRLFRNFHREMYSQKLIRFLEKKNYRIKRHEIKKIIEDEEVKPEVKKFLKEVCNKPEKLKIAAEQINTINLFIKNLLNDKYKGDIEKLELGLDKPKLEEIIKTLNFTKEEQTAYILIKKNKKIKDLTALKILITQNILDKLKTNDRFKAILKMYKTIYGKNYKKLKEIINKKFKNLLKKLNLTKEAEFIFIMILLGWLANNGLTNNKTFSIIEKVIKKIHSLFSGMKKRELEIKYLDGLTNIVKNAGDFKGINIRMFSNAFLKRLDDEN